MKLLRCLVILIVIGAFAPVAIAQEAPISVGSTSVETTFPQGMTFKIQASSDSKIVRAELYYTKAEDETLNLSEASFAPATSVDISLPIDFQVHFTPPGIELTYYWRLTDANGDTMETQPETVVWKDTRFDWEEVSTDEVSVYSYTGDAAFAKSVLDSAQATIDQLQADFSVEKLRRIRIWVYDSKADFAGTQAPNSQEWIVGTAYPQWQLIIAVLPDGDQSEVGRVVPHEISHQLLAQATKNPFNAPPLWFDEGMAGRAQTNGNEHFDELVRIAAEEGKLFSVRSLTSEFPYDSADTQLAYAESYSVVQFIIGRWGNEGIAAILDAYKTGVSHDDAFRAALGVDITELDRLWKESLGYEGDSGVAGGTHAPADDSSLNGLIVDATAILLVLAALASGIVMIRRSRSHRWNDDEIHSIGHAA